MDWRKRNAVASSPECSAAGVLAAVSTPHGTSVEDAPPFVPRLSLSVPSLTRTELVTGVETRPSDHETRFTLAPVGVPRECCPGYFCFYACGGMYSTPGAFEFYSARPGPRRRDRTEHRHQEELDLASGFNHAAHGLLAVTFPVWCRFQV